MRKVELPSLIVVTVFHSTGSVLIPQPEKWLLNPSETVHMEHNIELFLEYGWLSIIFWVLNESF